MKIHSDAPSEEVQIQIIPLIDVIFCILTFFILAALQFTHQQAIKVDLPKASTATPLPGVGFGNTQFREMIVVTISLAGQIYLDQKLVDRSQLSQDLQAYVQRNPNGILVLNASPNAFYNDVIQVLDVMRSVGGDRVALATNPTTSLQSPGVSPSPGASPFPSTSPTFNPFDPFNSPSPVPPSSGNSPAPTPLSPYADPLSPGGVLPSKSPGQ